MAIDVVMPQMGESIFEGTITKWLKKPGDKVERDEPLFEISTDKVDAEIPAPAAGVLREIKVGEGQTVPIQTIVGVIDSDGAAAAAPAPAAQPKAAAVPASAPAASAAKPAPAPPAPVPAAGPAAPPRRPGERIHSSPLVRRLAKENNIDLATVSGTGAGGRISKKDILEVIQGGASAPLGVTVTPSPSAPPAPPGVSGAQVHVTMETAVPRERIYFGKYELQPMSVMRQRIAEHMVASKRVSAHVYSIDEVDMTKVVTLRSLSKEEFERRHETKLTFMPFFVQAVVEGLRAFPVLNASVDGTTVVLHKDINIGMAVALDWGLIVPVIKNADEKNLLGIQKMLNDLAERARTKKLKPEEVQEGTFSITNPGVFGGLFGLPVINQPQVWAWEPSRSARW